MRRHIYSLALILSISCSYNTEREIRHKIHSEFRTHLDSAGVRLVLQSAPFSEKLPPHLQEDLEDVCSTEKQICAQMREVYGKAGGSYDHETRTAYATPSHDIIGTGIHELTHGLLHTSPIVYAAFETHHQEMEQCLEKGHSFIETVEELFVWRYTCDRYPDYRCDDVPACEACNIAIDDALERMITD